MICISLYVLRQLAKELFKHAVFHFHELVSNYYTCQIVVLQLCQINGVCVLNCRMDINKDLKI